MQLLLDVPWEPAVVWGYHTHEPSWWGRPLVPPALWLYTIWWPGLPSSERGRGSSSAAEEPTNNVRYVITVPEAQIQHSMTILVNRQAMCIREHLWLNAVGNINYKVYWRVPGTYQGWEHTYCAQVLGRNSFPEILLRAHLHHHCNTWSENYWADNRSRFWWELVSHIPNLPSCVCLEVECCSDSSTVVVGVAWEGGRGREEGLLARLRVTGNNWASH